MTSYKVARVGIFIDTIYGIMHAVGIRCPIGCCVASGNLGRRCRPGKHVASCTEAVRTPVAGGVSIIICYAAECHHSVGSDAERRLADAKEIEWVINSSLLAGKDIVRTNGHACAEGERWVSRIVGNLFHGVGAVEILHRYVWLCGEHYHAVVVSVDDGVPPLLLIDFVWHVVNPLVDNNIWTGIEHTLCLGAAAKGCRRYSGDSHGFEY